MSTERYTQTVTWDGKNLAAIQWLTFPLPRRHGRPAAEVTPAWDLTINDRFVPTGADVTVTAGGEVIIGEAP